MNIKVRLFDLTTQIHPAIKSHRPPNRSPPHSRISKSPINARYRDPVREMSLVPTLTTTYTHSTTIFTLASTFTEPTPDASTYISTSHSYPTGRVDIRLDITVYTWVQVPSTCNDIYDYSTHYGHGYVQIEGLKPNPDIAGLGVRIPLLYHHAVAILMRKKILLAFFVTAGSVVSLALVAYVGGFLPAHFLRCVDRRIFRANSRRENSRWRTIIENVTMSLSDQQLVTGLAILIAGYYEMMNSDLALYHWRHVIYLAWLSSAVHIASLTLLRDVLNKNPMIRNLRVAGMLILLTLLTVGLWPARFDRGMSSIPAKCFWTSTYSTPLAHTQPVDVNWITTIVMLLFAYAWKLSQLFASSRGLVRRWLVAKPEAAIERLMRRVVRNRRSKWLRWPAYKMLTICYITFVAWAEFAESFVASIVYLCLAFPYGVAAVVNIRWVARDDFIAGEKRLTFGQLVPLFLLVIPVLQVFELYTGMCTLLRFDLKSQYIDASLAPKTKRESPEAIYSLMASELHRPRENMYPDLTSALRLNGPSKSNNKLENDRAGSYDPIVDHVMRSRAFKSVVWTFFVGLATIGFTTVLLNIVYQGFEMRAVILKYGGAPGLFACVPLMTVFVLPCSRRLR